MIRPRTLPTRRCQRFASTSKWLSRLPVGKRPLTDVAAASASRHQQANCVCAIRLNNADGKSGRLRALQESGGEPQRSTAMCDYSLMHVKSRPASIGDKLRTSNFGTGTRGFAAPGDPTTAVCVLPGTELAFSSAICVYGASGPTPHKTAIFRQINREQPHMHHDALELPDGQTLLLTFLCEGQEATVLQLPAKPANESQARAQERAVFAG